MTSLAPEIVVRLNGPRIVVCAGCGRKIADEHHAVSIDECGEPTTAETGHGRSTCKAFHDLLYGYGTSMSGCPVLIAEDD